MGVDWSLQVSGMQRLAQIVLDSETYVPFRHNGRAEMSVRVLVGLPVVGRV